MNDILQQDLESDFNLALRLSVKKHSHEEIITALTSDNIVEKQLAVLELNEIKSKNDALVLVNNLVNQDGKVREVVAFKVNELVQAPLYVNFFIDEKIFDIFLQGIMDINGNICRLVVNLTQVEAFADYLCRKLPESIIDILKRIEELEANEKQYVISKRNFQLYWCLEALFNIVDKINFDQIKEILLITGEFRDYTIREKTAKILSKLPDYHEILTLKKQLANDENYYVRRYL